MRTTSNTPKGLLKKTRPTASVRAKRDAVSGEPGDLIRRRHQEDLRELAGRIDLDIDLKRSRRR